MANPTDPTIDYDYVAFQAEQQSSPFPGTNLQNDLQNLADAIAESNAAIEDVRRSDGQLKNGIVTADSLADGLLLGVDTPDDWATDTSYLVANTVWFDNNIYRALEAHTSGVFATDLAAGKWELVLDLDTPLTEAEASATAAAASEASAAADAATATTQAGIATTKAGEADASADAAAVSAAEAAAALSTKQDASPNLTTLAGIVPGAKGQALLATADTAALTAAMASAVTNDTLPAFGATSPTAEKLAFTFPIIDAIPMSLHDLFVAGELQADWFRHSTDGTNDALAVQRAIDYIESQIVTTTRGGTIRLGRKAYHWETIPVISEPSINIIGQGAGNIGNQFSDDPPYDDDAPTTVWIDHVAGEGLRVANQNCRIQFFRIVGGATREAAAYGITMPAIRVEGSDVIPGTGVDRVVIEGMRIDRHPGDGILAIGSMEYCCFDKNEIMLCKGMGIRADSGQMTTGIVRTNPAYPGLFHMDDNRIAFCGGNAIAISNPGVANGGQGYRVRISNLDAFGICNDAAVYYSNDVLYMLGENIEVVNCGLGGSTWSLGAGFTQEVVGGVRCGGKNIRLINNRFIATLQPVTWDNYIAGVPSKGLVIEEPTITQPTLTVTDFVKIITPASTQGLYIRLSQKSASGNAFTNFHTAGTIGPAIEYAGLRTSNGPSATIAAGILTTTASFQQVLGQGGVADDLDSILGFDGVTPRAGAVVTLINSQAYTITVRHIGGGGNIRTNTGASVALAPNTTIAFVSDGTRMMQMGL